VSADELIVKDGRIEVVLPFTIKDFSEYIGDIDSTVEEAILDGFEHSLQEIVYSIVGCIPAVEGEHSGYVWVKINASLVREEEDDEEDEEDSEIHLDFDGDDD
jgi:hypothetical protein